MDLSPVLLAYGFEAGSASIEPFGTGLINHSWKLTVPGKAFLVQRINQFVFICPEYIEANIRQIGTYLNQHHPDYLFVSPIKTLDGKEMVHLPELGYFRIFPFVAGSHSVDVVQTPEQAFEAAVQFGRFTRNLQHFDAGKLVPTIPDFHDLSLRYRQYTTALATGNRQRMAQATSLIQELTGLRHLVDRYEQIGRDPAFTLRVTHHDTKISNVLFDDRQKGLCVIDLDTVMPGYYISDVGDMMRTYLSPVSEEAEDVEQLVVRKPFCEAIIAGYMQEMHATLSPAEQNAFGYAGQFMAYMQALRFITDYLNDDVYYGARYPEHNFVRARNQLFLLRQLIALEDQLKPALSFSVGK